MSRRLRGTPRRGRVRRGIHTERLVLLNAQANGEGIDIEIPNFVCTLFNDWEDKLTGSHTTTNKTIEHKRNYWVVKNMLGLLMEDVQSQRRILKMTSQEIRGSIEKMIEKLSILEDNLD